jgi:protease-4
MKKPKPFTLLVILHLCAIAIGMTLLWRQPAETRRDSDTIVILPVEGMITMGHSTGMSGADVDEIVAAIDHYAEVSSVKAIVLKINSPGGSVGAVQAIHAALMRFRKKGKHVVASFGDVAASGGFYIACASERIVSYPGTLTASIGVILQLPNMTGLMQKIGVRMENVTSGAMKDAGSPFRTMTPDEQKYFKALVLDAYAQFFDVVRVGRKIPEADLRKIADGRVMSGKMAYDAKLVDQLGSLADAVDVAKELSGLSGKNPQVVVHKDKASLEKILSLLTKSPVERALGMSETGARLAYTLN